MFLVPYFSGVYACSWWRFYCLGDSPGAKALLPMMMMMMMMMMIMIMMMMGSPLNRLVCHQPQHHVSFLTLPGGSTNLAWPAEVFNTSLVRGLVSGESWPMAMRTRDHKEFKMATAQWWCTYLHACNIWPSLWKPNYGENCDEGDIFSWCLDCLGICECSSLGLHRTARMIGQAFLNEWLLFMKICVEIWLI